MQPGMVAEKVVVNVVYYELYMGNIYDLLLQDAAYGPEGAKTQLPGREVPSLTRLQPPQPLTVPCGSPCTAVWYFRTAIWPISCKCECGLRRTCCSCWR